MHQARDRGRGFLELVHRCVATGVHGIGDALAPVFVGRMGGIVMLMFAS
jgi:hypothetical protein